MTKYMAMTITVISGVTAALSTLPYGWAHIAATACAAAMGATGLGAGAYNLGLSNRTQPQIKANEFWPESGQK